MGLIFAGDFTPSPIVVFQRVTTPGSVSINLTRRRGIKAVAVAGEGEEKTVSRRSTVWSIFPEKVGIVFKEELVPQSLLLPSSSTTHIVVPSMDTWREC